MNCDQTTLLASTPVLLVCNYSTCLWSANCFFRFPRDDIARGRGTIEIVRLSKGLAVLEKKNYETPCYKVLSYVNGT